MPIDKKDVIELVCKLFEDDDLKKTIMESFKGGLKVGCGAVLGLFLLGLPGAAIGASLSGTAVAIKSHGKFKSVVSIIRTMDDHKRRQLADLVAKIVRSVDAKDALQLTAIVLSNQAMKDEIRQMVVKFLRTEMQLET